MTKNAPKWPKYDPKWHKMVQHGPRMTQKWEKQGKSSRYYSWTYFADVLKILKVSFSEIILWRIQTFQPDNFLPPWGNVLSHEKYISHCEKRKKLNHNYYRLGEAIVHKIKDFCEIIS